MRKLFLFMNVSLDGYFKDANDDISWANHDFEAFSGGESEEVDTLLFGHKTYEMMKFWATPQGHEMAPEVARFMNATPKLVASHSWFDPEWDSVTVLSGDVVGAVKRLKEQTGKTIAMFGSNTLCVSLMEAGLVDEFQILVNPVAIGEGTSLFAGLSTKVKLNLKETQRYDSGTVLLVYEAERR